jgi:peptidoglycan/xylan/chitin deacetylase (PgdA/CDA1 family)
MPNFRLDRFLTLHFFHPIAKRRRPQEGLKVPILMYHGIGGLQKEGSHPYYETATSPEVFAAHMAFLKGNGYRVVGLNELAGIFSNPGLSIEKCVVITFDDGLADFITVALPVLDRHGFSATVFLPAGLMGREVNGQACMTWDEVRESAAKGITFGSHSLTHPKLVDLTPPELEREIRGSKEKIEGELGQRIDSFSYPYAFPEQDAGFLKRCKELLVKSGYRSGVTTIIGAAASKDNRYFLKRLPMNDHDDLPFFKAKLEGGYDWLHAFQKVLKKAKRLAGAG